jgi:hypothetical protein
MQLKALRHRLTEYQLHKREERVLRRRVARGFMPEPAPPRLATRLARLFRWTAAPPVTASSLAAFIRRERNKHRAAAFKFAGELQARFERLRARRAPHCPHQYRSFGTIDRFGRRLKTDACGGKLQRSAGRLVCTSCGRGWRAIGAKQLVAA